MFYRSTSAHELFLIGEAILSRCIFKQMNATMLQFLTLSFHIIYKG